MPDLIRVTVIQMPPSMILLQYELLLQQFTCILLRLLLEIELYPKWPLLHICSQNNAVTTTTVCS